MPGIGNDNYRPGLSPPEPMKNTSWLSSNMAQLMVFLNGLILTITAYATLSVFIQEIVSDSLSSMTEETQAQVASSFDHIEKTVQTVGSFVSLSGTVDDQDIIDTIRSSSLNRDLFEQIYWVQPAGEESWRLWSVLESSSEENISPDFSGALKKPFLKYVLSQNFSKDQPTRILANLPSVDKAVMHSEQPKIFSHPFAVAHAVWKGSDRAGLVIGITSMHKPFEAEWTIKKEFLSSLRLQDTENGLALYQMSRGKNGMEEVRDKDGNPFNTFQVTLSDRVIDVDFGLAMDVRESFLSNIPVLMLFFGLTLTLIGTLYVRNNQKQSQRLGLMNKELAHKNYELNQEIGERERLNQAIQKAERENRAVIDSVSDIIFETDTEGELLL